MDKIILLYQRRVKELLEVIAVIRAVARDGDFTDDIKLKTIDDLTCSILDEPKEEKNGNKSVPT